MKLSDEQEAFISSISVPKFRSTTIGPAFTSYIPLERKFKIEDLFEFKRKDGDLFLSFICLLFAAFIILIDTFKIQLNNYLPGLNFFLDNFYESIKDFYLFCKDLIS